jgi:hypothetical protein
VTAVQVPNVEESGEVHDLAALPWYTLNRRLSGTQRMSGCYEEVEECLPLLGIEHQFLVVHRIA